MTAHVFAIGLASVVLMAEPKVSPNDLDRAALQGNWKAEMVKSDNVKEGDTELKEIVLHIEGNNFSLTGSEEDHRGTFTLDASETPKQINAQVDGEDAAKGIYKLAGENLTICWAQGDAPRPDKFESEENVRLMSLKRVPLTATEKVSKEVSEAWDAIKGYAFEKKEDLVTASQKQLDDMQPKIDELRARAKDATGEAKKEADRALATLEEKRKQAAEHLKKTKASSAAAWDDVKTGLGKAMHELDTSFQKASQHFKDQ